MTDILRQEYLVCYDVSDTKKRTKVFEELKTYGLRPVQKSVFWGYLTKAELNGIRRFVNHTIEKDDRTLITRTNFNGRGYSYLIGHSKEEFKDWDETCVI